MCVWINLLTEDFPILELVPQEGGVMVEVGDPDVERVLESLIALDDLDVARSLALLFVAGMKHAETDPATSPTVQPRRRGSDGDAPPAG